MLLRRLGVRLGGRRAGRGWPTRRPGRPSPGSPAPGGSRPSTRCHRPAARRLPQGDEQVLGDRVGRDADLLVPQPGVTHGPHRHPGHVGDAGQRAHDVAVTVDADQTMAGPTPAFSYEYRTNTRRAWVGAFLPRALLVRLCQMLQSRPETTAPANCSTARETASPRPVGAMPQVRDLRRISALRRGFPALACVAPLANVRVRSSFWPSQVRGI